MSKIYTTVDSLSLSAAEVNQRLFALMGLAVGIKKVVDTVIDEPADPEIAAAFRVARVCADEIQGQALSLLLKESCENGGVA